MTSIGNAASIASEAATDVRARSVEPVVGVGFMGVGGRGGALLRSMLAVPGVEVRGICDTDPGSLERAGDLVTASGHREPVKTAQWDALLGMDGIDAIVSALPCDLHRSNYLAVIAAGKDLYGEKPMCLNAGDCAEVVSAAAASRQIVQIGFQRRADPRFVEAMNLVHGGELGELVEARVCWSNAWGPLYDWFGKRARSGDWMVEQAVHNWDVLNWANGCMPVRAVGLGRTGLYRSEQPDRDVTDYYSALVEYENGVIVNILHSWVAPGQSGAYNRYFNDEHTRLIGRRAGIDFNSGTLSYRRELNLPDRVAHTTQGTIDSTQLCLQAFVDSVRSRAQPVAAAEHGRDAVLTCLLVREAVYRGGMVTMKEVA